MTHPQGPNHLESNLRALGDRNADIAAAIRAATPAPLEFESSRAGPLTARGPEGRLASRNDPVEEGRRLTQEADLHDRAVFVVLGFGLGYHVEALARRLERHGLIVVFESDVALLRAVFERVDHSAWLEAALVVFVTDPDDRGGLSTRLLGAEAILAQGVEIIDHPASARRLGDARTAFAGRFADLVTTARTTLMTTLVRSLLTVRNLLHNTDHYTLGPGTEDLRNATPGALGIVVAAGPSLRRNIELLAQPGVRDRCVIIAVQTMLKPLLDMGVRPHFVTALDFHEISGRFYEGLTAADVEGITLIAEAKAHPVILDSFPGTVRCCSDPFLDRVLGPRARPMGDLAGGATVAHLALYVARHLGCNPIALVGQDLGFPDGLYYTPGTAIHDVWGPELNAFNTIEMMEWQRIVRHRQHLHRLEDVHGDPIYSDAQMLTYLQQFERDFASLRDAGIRVIDATEGGVRKQHVDTNTLAAVLEAHARPRPSLPPAPPMDEARRAPVLERVADVQRDVAAIRTSSRRSMSILQRMLEHQRDLPKMSKLFAELDAHRGEAHARQGALDLVDQVNQLGAFKRLTADRQLALTAPDDPYERQRFQLERDLVNVRWLGDAARELISLLQDAQRVLRGETVDHHLTIPPGAHEAHGEPIREVRRVGAVVPVSTTGGTGLPRALDRRLGDAALLTHTLRRLDRIQGIDAIVLLAPDDFDPGTMITDARLETPIHVEPLRHTVPRAPLEVARRVAGHGWRGGLGGATVFDEVLVPDATFAAMTRHELDAAFLCGPDWAFVDVSAKTGADALIDRHRENPKYDRLTFTQAAPGLSGCVVARDLVGELAESPGATLGQSLSYQPQQPQPDPIATPANIQVDHRVRHALVRAIPDAPTDWRRLERAVAQGLTMDADGVAVVEALARAADPVVDGPQTIDLELTTRRTSLNGPGGRASRPDLTLDDARAVFDACAADGQPQITLGGAGDPLLHPEFGSILELARQVGVRGLHVRTELLADRDRIDLLLDPIVDIVSIDLHADTGKTYASVTGLDRFEEVLGNIEYLWGRRQARREQHGAGDLPWIAPRLTRCRSTYRDLESFYDRWQHIFGSAIIDPAPASMNDTLLTTTAPPQVLDQTRRTHLVLRSDGHVLHDVSDTADATVAGHVTSRPFDALWRDVLDARGITTSTPAEVVCA